MKRRRVLLYSFVFLVVLCSSCFGQTIIRVSTGGNDSNNGSSWALAKKTVQAGINAASTSGGGEIWVAAGTYSERITLKADCYLYGGFAGTESQRQERDFNVNKSMLDGSGKGHVVNANGLSTTVCIDGFTIRKSGDYNSGIYCYSSSPAITNNTICEDYYGIYCNSSSNPAITNNTICKNGYYGIYCISSNPTITKNTLCRNSYGIYCKTSSNPIVTNNVINENYNSGIYCDSSNPAIANNTISINSATAIYCLSSSPAIVNNTINGNNYGIYCYSSSSPAIANSIIAFNNISGIATDTSGSPTLKSNCVYGNATNYYRIDAGATDISLDPLLVNWRYNKLHIQPGSPCIDAGDSSVVGSSWVDMDGQARVQGSGVDIGADESDGTQWPVNPPMIAHVSPNGSDSNDGSSWSLAKKTIQAGIEAASLDGGGEIWVAAGTYSEHIDMRNNCNLYGGFAGTENQRQERDFNVNKSILNGSGSGSVVSANELITDVCIDGFTIRNTGSSGYGISHYLPSTKSSTSSIFTITNNTISGNKYGIYCMTSYSGATITNNVLNGNEYAIYSVSSSTPTIINNTINENSHGISITGAPFTYSAVISNNVITGNTNEGIICMYSFPSITNNTISGNSCGIYCYSISNPTPVITNNIIAFNATGVDNSTSVAGISPTLTKNCVYGNTNNYSGVTAGATDISQDPLLENWRYGKFHIQSGSPCIDAGDGSVVDSSWIDMDGQARMQGSGVDIGADESDGTQWPVNPPIIVRVRPNGNDSSDGSSWTLAKKTLQAGIDAVFANESGGEVWVAAGTYNEHITIKTDIDVYGGFDGTENQRQERNFNTNKSIIDGSGNGHVVSASGFATNACIDGFTIRNSGSSGTVYYYGIYCINSSIPTITNSTITGNSSGICCVSSNPVITNNIISGHLSSGISCNSSNPVIANNIISESAYYGIFCAKSSKPAIANNTIIFNGSGIYNYTSSSPAVTNNIIAFNTTGVYRYDGNPVLKNNCVYGNTTNYSNLTAGATDISVDPLIENPLYGKLHIQSNSPCVDAGDNSVVDSAWVDLDGQTRIQGSGVDIGADESDGTQWHVNSPIVVRISPNGNDSSDGSSWSLAKKTIQAGIDAVFANEGGEVWVAAGTYYEHIMLKANCDIYGGFTGTESQRTERDFNANKSIIDGSNNGTVVIATGFLTIARIDGFIIRGGSNCIGIYCNSSSTPIIANNTISGNHDGVSCVVSANPTITGNTIRDNKLNIFCSSSSPTIINNAISKSTYGIVCQTSSPTITNNTISGNNYGIECNLSSPTVSNNIITFNSTGIHVYSGGGSPTLKKNCVYGNTTAYSGLTAGTTDISVDPLFRDKDNGDYHLTSASPCINAGDDTAVQSTWKDMDGEARIIGTHVDIGADEYSVFDVTGINAKNTKDTAYVLAANMVVSSVYSDFYYVQDINRTYGIRVNQLKGTLPQVNQIISVNGVLGTTTDGERCLLSYETPSVTGQETPKPLMITCKYIGGGDYSYDSAAKTGQKGVKGSFGLNNIGLLVTVCGTVADIDTTNKKLYINDGSATVAVYYGSITLPSDVVKGAMVKATGACSCYRLDNENLSPLILLKDSNNITAMSNP
ncbi:MAG: right-handed parallel beta-helix repeat-containing protein [Armatimonadota bacterium]